MKRILAVTLFIFMLSGGAMAGSKAVPSNWQEATPEGMAEAGLDLLLKGDYAAMVDKFFETADRNLFGEEKVLLLKRQIVAQLPTYEKYLRYEFIRRETYGKSLVKLKYLVVGESVPICFTFRYYKPGREWKMISIFFGDEQKSFEN